jgi:hypothetical protein
MMTAREMISDEALEQQIRTGPWPEPGQLPEITRELRSTPLLF